MYKDVASRLISHKPKSLKISIFINNWIIVTIDIPRAFLKPCNPIDI